MNLEDLSPLKVFIGWEGESIKLKPFNLRAIVWAERFFFNGEKNGFERMNHILSGECEEALYNSIIDVIYFLGSDDFEYYNISCSVGLKNKVAESEHKSEIILEFTSGLEMVLLGSFPDATKEAEVKGGKIFQQIQKNKKPDKAGINDTNWGQIYNEFYQAGGMTIDQFMDMTMRQIGPLLEEIRFKKFEDLNLLSEIVQKKISFKKPLRKVEEEFSDEDIGAFQQEHERLTKRGEIN